MFLSAYFDIYELVMLSNEMNFRNTIIAKQNYRQQYDDLSIVAVLLSVAVSRALHFLVYD